MGERSRLDEAELVVIPVPIDATPYLRSWSSVCTDQHITLAELCEFYTEPAMELDMNDSPLMRRISRWQRYVRWRADHEKWMRGAGAGQQKGRHQWESTTTLKGLSIHTEARVADTKLEPLAIDTINANSKGIAMCVLASWGKMQHMEWVGPLVLVFPGRLGANDAQIQQMELLFCAPDGTEPFSRRVTTYVVTEHKVEWGANIKQIQWQSEKSVEVVLTCDSRWGTEITTKSVKQDWIVAARRHLGALTVSVVDIPMYAHKEPAPGQPQIWTAKARLLFALAEKAMSASGLEAVFIRAADTTALAGRESCTIVWAHRHDEASAQTLATLNASRAKLLGHRGLAHSQVGVGLRWPWTSIQDRYVHKTLDGLSLH